MAAAIDALVSAMDEAIRALAEGLSFLGQMRWAAAIVLGTVFLRLAMTPLTFRQMRDARRIERMRPELERLRRRYGRDRRRLAEGTAELYRRNGLHPLGVHLAAVAQAPPMIVVYAAIRRIVRAAATGELGVRSLPFLVAGNLANPASASPAGLLLLCAMAVLNWLYAQRTSASAPLAQRRVATVVQLGFVALAASMPAAVVLFWVTQTAVLLAQQTLVRS